jgi:hypothetical protein
MTDLSQSYFRAKPGVVAHRLPASKFPLVIRVLSQRTGAELWSITVERPDDSVFVPGRAFFGEPVTSRIEYADGTAEGST